jgi:hypothetical protein
MKICRRQSAAAAAIAVLFLLAPFRLAVAGDLADACTAGSNGMFQPKDCECFDSKATASDDRAALITYFKTMAAMSKGQQASMTSDVTAQMQKASSELLPQYTAECAK